MKAIILAGGLGSRLRPLTDSTPKPLLPVAGKPIIQWQMEWLKNAGVKDFVLSIGHLADKVQAVLGDGAGIGVSIRYAMEHEPLGTAGALRNAMIEGSVEGPFYAGNGDVLTDLDPRLCEGLRSAQGMVAALALVPLPSPYGIIEAEDNGLVTAFREKPLLPHWINAGFYSLSQDVFDYLPRREAWSGTSSQPLSKRAFSGAPDYTPDSGAPSTPTRTWKRPLLSSGPPATPGTPPGLGPGQRVDLRRPLRQRVFLP